MDDSREPARRLFASEERKPYGRTIRPPIELCARNFERPMYPLCYFCQKQSCSRDFFETNSGRLYVTIQLCPRCAEYNRASQEVARVVLQRYAARDSEERQLES